MIPANLNIDIYKGQTWRKKLTFLVDGVAIDITSYTFKAQIRPNTNSEKLSAEMSYDLSEGAEGIIYLNLTSEQTAALPSGLLVWDLQSVDENEETDYWVCGNITVYGRVTV